MDYIKKVRWSIPQKFVVYDYYLGKKLVVPYNPELRLIDFKRFTTKRLKKYDWLVICREHNVVVSLYAPLGSQGVLAGDTLEVYQLYPRRVRYLNWF